MQEFVSSLLGDSESPIIGHGTKRLLDLSVKLFGRSFEVFDQVIDLTISCLTKCSKLELVHVSCKVCAIFEVCDRSEHLVHVIGYGKIDGYIGTELTLDLALHVEEGLSNLDHKKVRWTSLEFVHVTDLADECLEDLVRKKLLE